MTPWIYAGIGAVALVLLSSSSAGATVTGTPPIGSPLITSDAVSRGLEGSLRSIPARALTEDQAKALLNAYVKKGLVKIYAWTSYAGRQKVSLDPTIAEVRFGPEVRVGPCDYRFAVFIIRLTLFLKERYQVTRIDHLSVVRDDVECPAGVTALSCHRDGRAIDFSGAQGPFGVYDVQKDWGNLKAPYPAGSRDTTYRIPRGGKGFQFFMDVWGFGANEGSASTNTYVRDEKIPSFPSGLPSFIIQPDYRDPALRAQHQNHIHMQIGPTCIPGEIPQ